MNDFVQAQLCALYPLAQRLAVNEFGDDEMRAVHLTDFMNCDDVRVIGCARGARLELETSHLFGGIHELRRQQLERDLAMQPFVFSQIYLTHPASAQQ